MKNKFVFFFICLLLARISVSSEKNSLLNCSLKAHPNCDGEFIQKEIRTNNGLNSDTSKYLVFSHSTYEDFSSGVVSNSGQNLFISRDGQIRFINWFDLNNDGFPEIVSLNDHDHYETTDGFIYYNIPGRGFRSLMPPVHEHLPGFQKLEWMEESSKSMGRIASLGGGRTLIDDINGDGYPEIMFTNFVHGWSSNHFPVFLYWGGEKGYDRSRMSFLPTLSGSGLAVADLNNSGRKDIVIANAGREYIARSNAGSSYFEGEKRVLGEIGYEEGTSFIYWQESYGFSVDNRSELPTEYALDVSIKDLNQDREPDIVFLQGGIPGSIRIFYGGNKGVDIKGYFDLKVLAPDYSDISKKMCVSDLNNDGWPDIFIPSKGDSSEIFWNGTHGFNQKEITKISTSNAVAGESKDLNYDGYNDLVIANNLGNSYIYWGCKMGLDLGKRTELPTNGATGVAISDLNNNGYFDIVFSNSVKGDTFDNPSFIYWGSEDGYHASDRDELWGFGAMDVAVGDFNMDRLKDIFLMNRQSGKRAPQFGAESYNPTDIFVFWGNTRYKYSSASLSTLPGVTAQASALAADVDGNGYADLVYTTNRGELLNIFYGDSAGYRKENNINFDIPFEGRTVLAADLNKDGFLDIIVGSKDSNEFAILLGKREGFNNLKIFDFGAPQYSGAIGDIDNDGKLDLVFAGHDFIKILYGTGENLFERKKTEVIKTGMFSTFISLADFNKDGNLDIFGHHFSKADSLWENNMFSAIYWNQDGSFSSNHKLELPSHGAHSGSVADVDKDGNLDILIANYNSQYQRNLETFIYLGDSLSQYSAENMIGLPSYSPIANLVLDLNGDGYNDIVVFNHSESNQYAGLNPLGGIHGTGSFIYWGSKDGWQIGMRSHLPSVGPHSRLIAEPGDIMQRRSYEEYESSPIEIETVKGRFTLKIEGDYNFRQNITLCIKEALNLADLDKQSWKEIPLTYRTNEYFLYEGKLRGKSSLIKYRLKLDTGGVGTGPIVKSVAMYK